jgi:bacillopeptidase F (M6 metalloprotease family)
MRRALALATALSLAVAGAASAETWTKVFTLDNGADINIDTDYTYKDRATGRLVIMQALSKGTTGPSSPGKADSIGSVTAIDCAKRNQITLASYKPNQPLDIKSTWRSDTPKKAEGADNAAIMAAVCPNAATAPVK